MTTSATVTRPGRAHPKFMTAVIGAACIAVGMVMGIATGIEIASNGGPVARPEVSTTTRAVPAARGEALELPGVLPQSVSVPLPTSAPGNPYVNIHVPPRQPIQQSQPSSAPGNPYVNIHVPPRQPAIPVWPASDTP